MDYRKCGDTIVLCLVRGEEVLSCIRKVCAAEQVRLAEISALGAADHAVVGVYHLDDHLLLVYEQQIFEHIVGLVLFFFLHLHYMVSFLIENLRRGVKKDPIVF